MKPIKNLLSASITTMIFSIFFISCSDDESSRVVVTMIDSPGDYVAVNLDIEGISVHANASAGDQDGGWTQLEGGEVGIKNIMNYTSGTELTLADTDFPTGRISQIRLHLGGNNTLEIEQEDESVITKDLFTTSGETSGIKLLVNENLLAGITYKFTLDFDVNKSVVKTSSGSYNLKPVIKVITEATSGAVQGSVTPAAESVAVYVIDNNDTVASSFAVADVADYLVAGVPTGTYTVSFDPGENSSYAGSNVEAVTVTVGKVTELDPVELDLK